MDNWYVLVASVLFTILLLAYGALFLVFRRSRRRYSMNEKALQEKLNALSESCKRNAEFFTNMTHELKTPLSVVLGAIQLIEAKEHKQAENDIHFNKNLTVMKYNCYRLLRLTNNLLDLSKMEGGYLTLSPVFCDLFLLIEEIIQSVMPYALQKQLRLNYKKPSEVLNTAVDIEKFERIMLNLLSNAIKFTPSGGTITVSAYSSEGRVYISVKDSGIGIPAESQEKIFNRFIQTGYCPSVENEGSGIGLSLVKSYVGLHQGNIKVNSEQGQGCEFVIDLPVISSKDKPDTCCLNQFSHAISDSARIEFSILANISI